MTWSLLLVFLIGGTDVHAVRIDDIPDLKKCYEEAVTIRKTPIAGAVPIAGVCVRSDEPNKPNVVPPEEAGTIPS